MRIAALRRTAAVPVFPMLSVTPRIQVPEDEFTFTFARSSGPGGQNVNKVNSKALLRWPVTVSPSLPDEVRLRFIQRYRRRMTDTGEVLISSQRFRDQARNVDDCLEKLREMILAVAQKPKVRKKTKPSRASKQRRLQAKREQSQKKQARREAGW
jgi:ribosome-associated protein